MRFEWYFLMIAFVIIGFDCLLFREKGEGEAGNLHQCPFKAIGEGKGKGKGKMKGKGKEREKGKGKEFKFHD